MENRTNAIADNQFFASGNASLIALPGIVQVRSHGNTHFENENISALDIVLFRRISRCTVSCANTLADTRYKAPSINVHLLFIV